MAKEKFYTEEELVEKVQSGEFGWLDYVNHHSREWKGEYKTYCESRGKSIDHDSASEFVEFKNAQLEEAMVNGEA
ncbi:MAG: hypothetical protein ACRC9L_02610 [Brevinema sp.]